MTEEVKDDVNVGDETPVEESTDEETTVEETDEGTQTEETQDDSEVEENTSESEAEDRNVPYDRFREVNEKYRSKEEEAEYWKKQAMQNAPQPQEPSVDEIPKHLIQEDGSIDPIGYAKWVQDEAERRAESRIQAREAENRAWQEATKVYPEIDEDPDLRDSVYGYMLAQVGKGQYMTPKQAADRLLGKIKAAKQEGVKSAQRSERIQKTADVKVSGGAPKPKDDVNSLLEKGVNEGEWDGFFEKIIK
jgi:hypothetical protein